jgi:nitrogen-specific signal transduction histidine kinase
VKAIVERHGGRIEVASAPGRTVFTVTLPHASVADGAADRDADATRRQDQPASASL